MLRFIYATSHKEPSCRAAGGLIKGHVGLTATVGLAMGHAGLTMGHVGLTATVGLAMGHVGL